MLGKKPELISLKEAAKISGYSSDYIGQLIRSGKLPGKQIFSHVAWMTTEEDLRAYMESKGGEKTTEQEKGTWRTLKKKVMQVLKQQIEIPKLFNKVVYLAIAVSVLFLLFLFYVLSAAVEHRLDQRAIENVEARTAL